jgi:hypothetical protein
VRQEAQGGLGREEAYSQARPLLSGSTEEEETAVAALTTTVVGAAATLAQAVNAPPPWPAPDPPRKCVKSENCDGSRSYQ